MDYRMQQILIINMVVNNASNKNIADTLNISEEEVKAFIKKNKDAIAQKRKEKETEIRRIENEERHKVERENKELSVVMVEDSSNETSEKGDSIQEERFLNSNKKNKTLYELKQKIVMGNGYNQQELANTHKRVVRACIMKKNRTLVEGLVEIYLQLNQYTKAKALTREIFDEEKDEDIRDQIVKEIERQELIYNIMKQYRNGRTYDEISKDLNVYTIDVIRVVKKEKKLDETIIKMSQDGMEKEEIINELNLNTQRVNTALLSKDKNSHEEPTGR